MNSSSANKISTRSATRAVASNSKPLSSPAAGLSVNTHTVFQSSHQSSPQTRIIPSNVPTTSSAKNIVNKVTRNPTALKNPERNSSYNHRNSSIQESTPVKPLSVQNRVSSQAHKNLYNIPDIPSRPATSMRIVSSSNLKPRSSNIVSVDSLNNSLNSSKRVPSFSQPRLSSASNHRASVINAVAFNNKVNTPTNSSDININATRVSLQRSHTSMQKINTPTSRNNTPIVSTNQPNLRPGTSFQNRRPSVQRPVTSMNLATRKPSTPNIFNSSNSYNTNNLPKTQNGYPIDNQPTLMRSSLSRGGFYTPSISRINSSSVLAQNLANLNSNRVNTPTSLNPTTVNSIINKIKSTNINHSGASNSLPSLNNVDTSESISISKTNILKARQLVSELIKINSSSNINNSTSCTKSDFDKSSSDSPIKSIDENGYRSNHSTLISVNQPLSSTSDSNKEKGSDVYFLNESANNSKQNISLLYELQNLLG
ncbi:hypothetical protein BB561_006175 [Smittium simulii]|uniref:Uncharacterized protein n=1 Tax=Smittium simulii TaxID=133385 RepID=A0A2T9Y632_9FUNG|nr:hypothetical protein BB561_006175 [Smittium simulii]